MFLPSDLCVHEMPFSVELVSVKYVRGVQSHTAVCVCVCVTVEITHSESVCVFDLLYGEY